MNDHTMNDHPEQFELRWYGDVVVVIPASGVESLKWDAIQDAADLIMQPLEEQPVPLIVFDLSEVDYFGSIFLAMLLRCHKYAKGRGGEIALCGCRPRTAELLQVTALDTLWPMYDTRDEAVDALQG